MPAPFFRNCPLRRYKWPVAKRGRGTLSESESLVLHTFQEDDSCIQKLAGALVADMLKKGPFRDDIMNVLVDVILGTFLIQPIRIAILYRLFELVERHSISIWYCICHRIGNDRNLVPPEGSADCFYRIILVPGMLLFRVDKNLLVPVTVVKNFEKTEAA